MDELELIRSFGRNDAISNPAVRAAARDRLLAHIANDRSVAEPPGQPPARLSRTRAAAHERLTAAKGCWKDDALVREHVLTQLLTVERVIRCLPADLEATQLARAPSRPHPVTRDLSYLDRLIHKPWGSEFRVYEDDRTDVWCWHIKPVHRTSLHCHPHKHTALLCLEGTGTLSTCIGVAYPLEPGVVLQIEPGAYHRCTADSETSLRLIGVETPKDKFDLLRIDDDYRDLTTPYEGERHAPLRLLTHDGASEVPLALRPLLEQHLPGNHRARLRAQDSTGRYHFALETGEQIRASSHHFAFAIKLQPRAKTPHDVTVIGPERVFTTVPGNLYLTIRP